MRYLLTPLCLMLSVLLTSTARAEDDAPKNEDRAGRRAEMRQKMLEEFDADNDGELSDEERAKARETMRSRRGDKPRGDKAQGRKQGKRGGKGRRGPGGPPDPAKLFDKYDANDDGQLSREEFMKLSKAMRPPRGPGKGRGPRPDGPPPEGRRRNFDRERPLQNPDDRPGPPPRPAGRRRLNDEESPREAGYRARGREGHRPPRPEEVFERFDENDDDQLSRDEFMKLADRMRELHERHRHGKRGRGGAREGRGAPGEDGPPRRRRPPPAGSETGGPELPASADNSV